MRIRALAYSALITICSGAPLLTHAQFQEPTPEERQMTSDPKAPGADAVYLYREETVDDMHHFHSFYARIKILTEKGKAAATVTIPYDKGSGKIADIKGRTIHADGTVIALTAKPSDLVDVKVQGFQLNKVVFTLPDAQVGSILEYRLNLQYDEDALMAADWKVQQPYFVHKAHYMFYPSTSAYISNNRGETLDRQMSLVTPPGSLNVVRDSAGHYSLDASDVPPIPDDDWMPPLNTVNWRAHIYYTHVTSVAEYWQSEMKRWEKVSDAFATPTKGLKDAASQIVGSGDSDEVKARKLYDAVMKLENTDFTRAKSEAERKKEKIKQARDAEGVWKQKSGSSDQIALLYIALARAAGLTAYPMQVVDRDQAVFNSSYLSSDQLDDYIAIVVVGGKEVFLDPGQAKCPYGLLHWKHTLAGGVRVTPNGINLELSPANTYTQNQLQRVANLQVAPDGSVTGTVKMIMNGQDALRWRQLAVQNDAGEVKKQFDEWMKDVVPDGVQADLDHFDGLDDYNADLVGMVKVTGQLASATGKRFFLPGQFFAAHGSHPFVAQQHRVIPIDVHYPVKVNDDVTYALPEGFTADSAPLGDIIPCGDFGQLRVSSKMEKSSVEVTRTLEYNFTILEAKDYGDLHDFYQKVARADQQQVVLSRSAQSGQ